MEVDKAIEFLLNQQIKSDPRLEGIETHLDRVIDVLENLTEFRVESGFLLSKLAEGQAAVDKRMAELSESQKHSDERLNVLIRILQDHIERHPPPSGSA